MIEVVRPGGEVAAVMGFGSPSYVCVMLLSTTVALAGLMVPVLLFTVVTV